MNDDPKPSKDFFHEVADLATGALKTVTDTVKSVGDGVAKAVNVPKGDEDAGAIGDTPKAGK